MLSRVLPMPASATPFHCDIFCNVIDNYGDIGVCWRLAKQLATEHGLKVRLWVNELPVFSRICPGLDPELPHQTMRGVEILHWTSDFQGVVPGQIVIEAFACQLPDVFVGAMAIQTPEPVWINLEYLSAEAWVSGCHALPSPHPYLPLTKFFFFPGFDETTGGLLRESSLIERREQFKESTSQQAAFWKRIGCERPASDALIASLFAYENPALPDLLRAWERSTVPICCLAPMTATQTALETFAGRPLQVGDVVIRSKLEIHLLPFVSQEDYDFLLWSSDLNFVRGEDSFVRAQWAARPMIWQIYPQEEEVHRIKLDAFLDRYCAELPKALSGLLRDFFHAWNGFGEFPSGLISRSMAQLPTLRLHAEKWAKNQSKQEDLCSSLVRFCVSKL